MRGRNQSSLLHANENMAHGAEKCGGSGCRGGGGGFRGHEQTSTLVSQSDYRAALQKCLKREARSGASV